MSSAFDIVSDIHTESCRFVAHTGQVCSGHGHPEAGKCHCNSGYIVDPRDSSACIAEGNGSVLSACYPSFAAGYSIIQNTPGQLAVPGNTEWILSAADIVSAVGSDNVLFKDNLTAALLLISSCQMDPTCSLNVTTKMIHNEPAANEVGDFRPFSII